MAVDRAAAGAQAGLPAAVAANSVGINVSRAVGPALGGVIIAVLGIAAPFWLNAFSNLGVIGACCGGGSRRQRARCCLPSVSAGAIRAGLRHARHNPHLRATLMRAAGFFLFASAYWALLPLVARKQIAGGPGSTACCSASSAPARSVAPSCCRAEAKAGPDR